MNRKTMFMVIIALLVLIAFFKHPAYFIGVVLVTWAIDYLHKTAKMGWAASLISWGVLVILWVTFIAPMVEGKQGLWRRFQEINLNMARKTNSPAVEQNKALFNYSVALDSLQAEKLKKGLDSLKKESFSKDDSASLRKIVLGVKDNATLEERLAKAQDPFPPEEKFQKMKEQLGDKWFEKEIAKLEKQKQALLDDTAKSAKDIETFLQEIEKVKASYQRFISNQGLTTDREKTSANDSVVRVDTLVVPANKPFPTGIMTPDGFLSVGINDERVYDERLKDSGPWADNSKSFKLIAYYQKNGKIRLEATGKVVWIDYCGYKKECDPNGTPREELTADPFFNFSPYKYPCPEADPGALIGRYENEPAFFIGKSRVIG